MGLYPIRTRVSTLYIQGSLSICTGVSTLYTQGSLPYIYRGLYPIHTRVSTLYVQRSLPYMYGGLNLFGHAKVGEFERSEIAREHKVCGFKVAVHDDGVTVVEVVEASQHVDTPPASVYT
jgi:hypothetical protein